MRNVKIVCTLGPATNTYEQIRTRIEAGMNVARMNLSHGTHDDHEEVYANIRRAAEDLGQNVAVLVDLQGPKIRDRKSTRLNSSHVASSYAVFCLKKKKQNKVEKITGGRKKKEKHTP